MSSSRRIGVAFEQEIARRFRRWFPDARRGLQPQAADYCPDIVKTPFYVECKRGKKYIWDGYPRQSLKPHNEADMAWLYGNVQDKADEWDGDWDYVIVVWKLTDKKYCVGQGRGHKVMVTLAHNDWWKIRGTTGILELQDILSTITWTEFAEALDKRYEVRR